MAGEYDGVRVDHHPHDHRQLRRHGVGRQTSVGGQNDFVHKDGKREIRESVLMNPSMKNGSI